MPLRTPAYLAEGREAMCTEVRPQHTPYGARQPPVVWGGSFLRQGPRQWNRWQLCGVIQS